MDDYDRREFLRTTVPGFLGLLLSLPTLCAMAIPLASLRFPHFGEILQTEFLEPMGISQYHLAMDLKIPHSRVTTIIRSRRVITLDTALRLSRYFGTSAEFWIGLQQEYDLRKARAESGKEIEFQVSTGGLKQPILSRFS